MCPLIITVLDSSGYESDTENSNNPCDQTTPYLPLRRRRRDRTQFSTSGLATLESSFAADRYPDIHARERLADELGVTEDRIQVNLSDYGQMLHLKNIYN